jgi:hypothetical protein
MARVYLSSTFADLVPVRARVAQALRQAGHDTVAMEDYVAADERPLERCLNDVATCDAYVGIIAWRYGFTPPGQTQSITELELRQAVRLGKPCLLFLLHDDAPWPRPMIDRDGIPIERLRDELRRDFLVSFFHGADDLAVLVTAALAKLERAPSQARVPATEFLRTPTLGLEVWQGEHRRPLLRLPGGAIRVPMVKAPLEIRLPRVAGVSVMITAAYHSRIFSFVGRETQHDDIPFFALGTGMADTSFGSGELWVTDDSHMHLDWRGRLLPGDDENGSVMFHTVRGLHETQDFPSQNVYLVVHVPERHKRMASQYNCERLVFEF